MKKSLILLIAFCFALCMIFTACTELPSQETTTAGSASGEQTTSATEESTTETGGEDDGTKFYTRIRETQALQTEPPELQEKIDRNHADGLRPEIQQKVILQIGDKRDVPYHIQVSRSYVENHKIEARMQVPDYYDLREVEEYLTKYTYSGTETFSLEVNDELLPADKQKIPNLQVYYVDGSFIMEESFQSLEAMYAALPKGEYYVCLRLRLLGNDIVTADGEHIPTMGRYSYESRIVQAAFILELQ